MKIIYPPILSFVLIFLFLTNTSHAIIFDSPTSGIPGISFDNNNTLWVYEPHGSGEKGLAGNLWTLNPSNGILLNSYFVSDQYNGIGFDSNNNMYLVGKFEFTVINPVDNIFFNGNDLSTIHSYPWPYGDAGFGTMSPIGVDFDQNGNMVIGRSRENREIFWLSNDFTTYSSIVVSHPPMAIAIAPNGDIYFGLNHIDVIDGNNHSYLSQGLFEGLPGVFTGMAFDNAGSLWVNDAGIEKIYILNGYSTVPEPATMLLYGLGFAGAGVYRRMRKRQK